MSENNWLWKPKLILKNMFTITESKQKMITAKRIQKRQRVAADIPVRTHARHSKSLIFIASSERRCEDAEQKFLLRASNSAKGLIHLKNAGRKSRKFEKTYEKESFIRGGRAESGDTKESPLSARYPRYAQSCPRQRGLISIVSVTQRNETQSHRRRVSFRYCYHQFDCQTTRRPGRMCGRAETHRNE